MESDLKKVLDDVAGRVYANNGSWYDIKKAIVEDGRIGILPTTWQVSASLQGGCGFRPDIANRIAENLVSDGFAREDKREEKIAHIDDRIAEAREAIERKYAPDPDNAAVDAIAKVIENDRDDDACDNNEYLARAVLAHMRENLHLLGIPVMYLDDDSGMPYMEQSDLPMIVLPRPDPPAAEPVPSVDVLLDDLVKYAGYIEPDIEAINRTIAAIQSMFREAAQGRADDDQ